MHTLRYGDMQDAILQASLDTIGIDSSREAEAAMELPNTAFADPVLVLGLLLLLMMLHILPLGLGNLLALGTFILDAGLVVRVVVFLTLLRDAAGTVDDALVALVVLALDTTLDD